MSTNKKPAFILLFLLISFASVSAVLFTPALPEISAFFGVSNDHAQLTITLFLIGYAFGQLLYGPLANGYGRKIALYMGISLEIISSLVCVLSASLHAFWLLVTARLFMALGASVGLKMSFTLIADCYSSEQARKIISHLMIAFAVTPGLGVALGGFSTQYFGWQSCFYLLAIYGVLLLALTYRMQETATTLDPQALKISNIIHKYKHKLKNKQLVLASIVLGIGTAFVYVFAALAPFVAMQSMHITASEYGLWNLVPPIGIIVGSQLSAYLGKHLRAIYAIFLGIIIMAFGLSIMLTAFGLKMLLAIWLFLPLAIIYIGISLIFANASTLAMQKVEDKSSASAMMNFINMGIATASVLLIGLMPRQSTLLLPLTYLGLIVLSFILTLILAMTQESKKDNKFVSPDISSLNAARRQ